MNFLAIVDSSEHEKSLTDILGPMSHAERIKYCDDNHITVYDAEKEYEPYYIAMMNDWCSNGTTSFYWKWDGPKYFCNQCKDEGQIKFYNIESNDRDDYIIEKCSCQSI